MKHWPVKDAKARFSELLDASLQEGPQIVTRRGVETAVLVPIEEWNRLKKAEPSTLKELLLADEPRFELDLPARGRLKLRPPLDFDDQLRPLTPSPASARAPCGRSLRAARRTS